MFWISMTCFSQNTYVPDDNFETALVNLGYDTLPLDDYVPTANIITVTSLNIQSIIISEFTGLEDFTALTHFTCGNNNLNTLDVSQNTLLTHLYCANNNLSTLDVSQNTALIFLNCYDNNLSALDVSQNTALITLYCYINNLSILDLSQNTELSILNCHSNNLDILDVSQNTLLTSLSCTNNNLSTLTFSENTALTSLNCGNNNLSSLNVKNGNNTNFSFFRTYVNPNLNCIDVDDATWSTNNWTYIDSQTSFNEDCGTMSIDEFSVSEFKMYPNPASELLTIRLNQDANYLLMNVNDQVFKKGKITNKENTIDVSNLSSGIYFLKFKTDKGVLTKKFTKQ